MILLNILTKTLLYKQIKKVNGKFFVTRFFNKTELFTKMGIYVPTKFLGKSIHDSERNRKRKAKKKHKKVKHKETNPIAMHLGLTTLWLYLFKHTRNMSAQMLVNYIVTKLDQYFTVPEILKPITYDLKTSPFFSGFTLMVVDRVTRKERAAFMVKQWGNLPLNTFSAIIDYAAESKIMKFGMVGIKAILNRIKNNSSYYRFNFINDNEVFLQKMLCWIIIISMMARSKVWRCHYHTNSPRIFGRPIGSSGGQELEKAAELAGVSKEEMYARMIKNRPFNSFYGIPYFMKDFSKQMHVLYAKVLDKDHMAISHSYTTKSEIQKNIFQKGIKTMYYGKTNLMGQKVTQYYLQNFSIMHMRDWKAYDQKKFFENGEELLTQEETECINQELDFVLEYKSLKGYAYAKEHNELEYYKTEFAQQDKNKLLFYQKTQYDAYHARKLANDNAILFVEKSVAINEFLYRFGHRTHYAYQRKEYYAKTYTTANGIVVKQKIKVTYLESKHICFGSFYGGIMPAEQKTIGASSKKEDMGFGNRNNAVIPEEKTPAEKEAERLKELLKKYSSIIDNDT